jgi:uncharacterized paraquat-inducible protein A
MAGPAQLTKEDNMFAALAVLAAILVVPVACAVVAVYVPIWIGFRLGWWR